MLAIRAEGVRADRPEPTCHRTTSYRWVMDQFPWAKSCVVVTGGSRGIGLAIATAARARGARVGLIARSADDLERAVARLGGPSDGKIAAAVADVASRSELEGALTELESGIGPIDVLVNNAGTGAYGPFGQSELDSLERALSINYLGTVYGTRAVLPGMIERRHGHIVNIASVAGRVATPGESAYSASKFAVVGFTQCVAMELRGNGVGITMILPGPVDLTGYFPSDETYERSFPPMVPADRVARATLRAVDRRQLEVVVPPWFRPIATLQATFSGLVARLPAGLFEHEDVPAIPDAPDVSNLPDVSDVPEPLL
jgi:short-subunit dehydrogenase